MKPKILALGVISLMVLVGAGIGFASDGENPNASAKATAQIAELNVFCASATEGAEVDWDSTGCVTILTQDIKTANGKDLFIDVSLMSGLYTETNVKSKGGVKDTSAAGAAVLLAVFVDGEMAFPGHPIIFNARIQALSAQLQGIISVDPEGVITVEGYENISLIIGTMSANSFSFIVPDLGSGMHMVEVKAACVTGAYSQAGSAAAMATIGLGSVTIEEVRMVKGENVIVELP